MARVLALLASGRAHGFTAGLLEAAALGASRVPGAAVECVHLHAHRFGPCISCFNCIRDEVHRCTLPDAMGTNGELMAKVRTANALLIADPVHKWGPSAMSHLFIERLYPFVWSGELQGMPFASISCASNQGMHRLASQNLCKWAFTLGMRYLGGMAVHTSRLDQARRDAGALGRRLALAAVADARGRAPYGEEQRYSDYLEAPWNPLEHYLDNLTDGTMAFEGSLIAQGLTTFRREEARALLRRSRAPFEKALACYRDGEQAQAARLIVEAGSLWTHATWLEFLEEEVIGSGVPPAYRPISE